MRRIKLLIADDDPYVYDLISQDMLSAQEYELFHAIDGAEAIRLVQEHQPDIVLLDLVMPGLTGMDVLVGLQQQNYQQPIIVTTKREHEKKAIEAFRLGATDFVTKPLRPPELMDAIERAMKQVRLQQERIALLERLKSTNTILEQRVHELTLLAKLGQSLAGMRSLEALYDTALSNTVEITGADHATLMLKDAKTDQLRLIAGKNLTLVMQDYLGDIVRDEVASLVMTSQEPLVAAGEGLQRFKLSREIKAIVYVPVIAQDRVLGVLTIGNHRKTTAFTESHAGLLRAISNFLAVGLTNNRLIDTLEQRAHERTAIAQKIQEAANAIQARVNHAENANQLEDYQKVTQSMAQIAGQISQFARAIARMPEGE